MISELVVYNNVTVRGRKEVSYRKSESKRVMRTYPEPNDPTSTIIMLCALLGDVYGDVLYK